MSREPKNGAVTTTHEVLTHHSNAFGDIVSTMGPKILLFGENFPRKACWTETS